MARSTTRRVPLGWLTLLLCLVTPPAAEAQVQEGDALRGLPVQDGPIQVSIGFHLIKITDVDEREETIDFEGGIYLMWKDPRQAYDPAAEGLPDHGFTPGAYNTMPPRLYQGDFAVKEVFVGWRPQVRLNNGIGDRAMSYMAVGIWPDGMVVYTDQFHAKAETPMALRAYPFDTQRLEIFVSPYALGNHRVKLVHAPGLAGSWEQDSGIADWKILGIDVGEETTDFEMLDGTDRTFSQLVVGIGIERRPSHIL
ncbi:MAG: hypothetical protein JRH11_07155, partial [Deltaproteobacteria bacterium]|nr:hypothetical protein [Deltaproteobacteria bacterium]